jgi:hypothetical protein
MPYGESRRHQGRAGIDRDDAHVPECYFAAAFWRLKWPRPGR